MTEDEPGAGEADHRDELRRAFGAEVAEAIREWEAVQGTRLHRLRQLTTGATPARVVVAFEQPEGRCPRKLVTKVSSVEDADERPEAGRHLRALRSSATFAKKHLVDFVYDPLRIGNGTWVVFQELAGGSLDDIPPLSVLVDAVADGRRPSGWRCDADLLASACRSVVRSVLEEWGTPRGTTMDAVTFLRKHLGRRSAPGGRLDRWVPAHGDDVLGSTSGPLPDPLALATDPSLTEGCEVWGLMGPAHGDLHPENVLVPRRRGQLRVSGYRLVDLSRFEEEAPLSRDPVHLLLSIVGRHLDSMSSPGERDALIRLLVDPADPSSGDLVPTWVHKVTVAVAGAAPRWVERSFTSEWREQATLSLLACALIFTGRRTTPDVHRPWFFRLAAAAGQAYLERAGRGV